jgi:hypothetical protein
MEGALIRSMSVSFGQGRQSLPRNAGLEWIELRRKIQRLL